MDKKNSQQYKEETRISIIFFQMWIEKYTNVPNRNKHKKFWNRLKNTEVTVLFLDSIFSIV